MKTNPYEPGIFQDVSVLKSKMITLEDRNIVPMEYMNTYCVNKGIDREGFVLKKGGYAFHMMNLVEYLIGNTDWH